MRTSTPALTSANPIRWYRPVSSRRGPGKAVSDIWQQYGWSVKSAIPESIYMTQPDAPRHIEIRVGDQMVAAAEVTTTAGPQGTARTSLHAAAGHLAPGWRANLVDTVMDLPEVQASQRLEATVPLGDGEFLQ